MKAIIIRFWNNSMVLCFSVIASFLLVSSCKSKTGDNANAAAAPPPTYPVFKVISQSATLKTRYPATLQGQQNIEIRPKIDGYIEEIHVDEGSVVKKGQLLFVIRAPQYQQDVNNANAAISSAAADVSTAELQVKKTKPLVEKDIISKYELESAEYTLEARKAALAQAKGTGEIYSYSVSRRAGPVVYCIAYVKMEEGVSMLTNIVDCDLDTVKIGQKVKVTFKNTEGGVAMPVFTPA